MIEVKKITPTIGAMIKGVNFSEPIKENVFDQIYEILIENLVIFFRNVPLSFKGIKWAINLFNFDFIF